MADDVQVIAKFYLTILLNLFCNDQLQRLLLILEETI